MFGVRMGGDACTSATCKFRSRRRRTTSNAHRHPTVAPKMRLVEGNPQWFVGRCTLVGAQTLPRTAAVVHLLRNSPQHIRLVPISLHHCGHPRVPSLVRVRLLTLLNLVHPLVALRLQTKATNLCNRDGLHSRPLRERHIPQQPQVHHVLHVVEHEPVCNNAQVRRAAVALQSVSPRDDRRQERELLHLLVAHVAHTPVARHNRARHADVQGGVCVNGVADRDAGSARGQAVRPERLRPVERAREAVSAERLGDALGRRELRQRHRQQLRVQVEHFAVRGVRDALQPVAHVHDGVRHTLPVQRTRHRAARSPGPARVAAQLVLVREGGVRRGRAATTRLCGVAAADGGAPARPTRLGLRGGVVVVLVVEAQRLRHVRLVLTQVLQHQHRRPVHRVDLADERVLLRDLVHPHHRRLSHRHRARRKRTRHPVVEREEQQHAEQRNRDHDHDRLVRHLPQLLLRVVLLQRQVRRRHTVVLVHPHHR
eukprot:Rhum_TRINITY_DN14269_c10_g1::Rhum_TRINITY_DN14269_c10_g1_i1::g.78558::m.78558